MYLLTPIILLCILGPADTCSSCMDFRSKNTADVLRELVYRNFGKEAYDTMIPQDWRQRSANSRNGKADMGGLIPKARIVGKEPRAGVVVLRQALVMESFSGFKIIAHHIPAMTGRINEHDMAREACFITVHGQNLDLNLIVDYPAASGKTKQFLYRDRIGNVSYKTGRANQQYKAQIYAGKDHPLLKIVIQKPTIVFLK